MEKPMRIIIPVKQVPETRSVKFNEESGTLERENAENILNPLDLYAVETALKLKNRSGAELTALTMGPPAAEKALRETLAMGVDSAVLLTDRKFAGSDTAATARILKAAILKLGHFDMIICGERATDGDTAQTGVMLARFLGIPPVTYAASVPAVRENFCEVRRRTEHGIEEIKVKLPCLISVMKETGEPSLPTLNGKIRAKSAEIQAFTAEKLGLADTETGLRGSPTRVIKTFRPKIMRKTDTVIVSDGHGIEEASAKFAEIVAPFIGGAE